jgi:phosphoribosylaminoimidazole-succinocarboxamide synthase
MDAIITTNFSDLQIVHRGKVRDMYSIPGHDDKLLMVATDRISAYDVVMNEPIPGKGKILTQLSLFWFALLGDVVDNHLISANVQDYPQICQQYASQLEGRSMLVHKTKPLPIECIVRGYISGSFWSAYSKSTTVCGFSLPAGMKESEQFAEPLFTPSTKAELGTHDENISLETMAGIVGKEKALKIAEISINLYRRAADYARGKGIIIADTKFELGLKDDKLILIDEVLTPDSSRFWPLDLYQAGKGQPSFDKQFLRDYLSGLDWDKTPPAPALPPEIIDKTRQRYLEAVTRITGKSEGGE